MYYQRHLPHWQPHGAALFITWRLHGSLPRTIQQLHCENPGSAFAALDRELDAGSVGPRWLCDDRVAQCVVDALQYAAHQLSLYRLVAWVLMPNHVHILIEPEAELPRITKSVKNYSARSANVVLGRTGQPFWQDESFDRWVRRREEREKIIRYIESNPVVAGLVENAGDWRWSSAFGR